MKIYIASSWKNQHAVEMLTALLREKGHEVISWIENNFGELKNIKELSFDVWIETEGAQRSFDFDSLGAMYCDCFIYVGPSGKDAAAECGMAYAKEVFMIALWAKGEDFGLMRKMFGDRWCGRYQQVLDLVEQYELILKVPARTHAM